MASNLRVDSIVPATGSSVSIGTATGGVNIPGVLTYEDVTNVDSIGIVTARSGVHVGPTAGVGATIYTDGGARFSGIVTATAFHGDGSSLSGVGASFGNSSVNSSGIATFSAFVPTSQEALSHRNRIINGAMQVWQRGTTFASQGNGQNDYTADRWAIGHNNSHMAAVTRATGPANDFIYCARIQRDSGNSQTDQMRFHTALETLDVRSLRNKILTISYYARKGANYSEANSKITGVRIATGENTDGDPNAYSGGHWTNATTILTGTPTLTTSWQRFSHTTSAVSNYANSMLIEFRHTPVGTAGANDWYEITGVQLEIGIVATPFEYLSYQENFRRCCRYYWKSEVDSSWGYGGYQYAGGYRMTEVRYPVSMRATPTSTVSINHGGTTFAVSKEQFKAWTNKSYASGDNVHTTSAVFDAEL